jgi:hypothetical protein
VSKRREVEARIGARWGERAVLLEVVGGEPLRAPLPVPLASFATEGRVARAYLNDEGGFDGWALPDEKVGVRMDADTARWGSTPGTLDCQGRCQVLWYVVAGGTVSPDDGCLTCGAPVAAA